MFYLLSLYNNHAQLICKFTLLIKFDNSFCHSRTFPCGKKGDKNFLRTSRMMLAPFVKLDADDAEIDKIMARMKETKKTHTKKHPGVKNLCLKDKLMREFCQGLMHRTSEDENIRTT